MSKTKDFMAEAEAKVKKNEAVKTKASKEESHSEIDKYTDYGTRFHTYTRNTGSLNSGIEYDWWDCFFLGRTDENTRLPKTVGEILYFSEDKYAKDRIEKNGYNIIVCQTDGNMGAYPTFRFERIDTSPIFEDSEKRVNSKKAYENLKVGKSISESNRITSPDNMSGGFHLFYFETLESEPICIGTRIF